MKISKHLHSCLLVEDGTTITLIDPGEFTQNENALDISQLSNLKYIAITHEHADHLSLVLVKQCLEKFPDVQIMTNSSVAKKLQESNIRSSSVDDVYISIDDAPHEKVFGMPPPENSVITINGKLTHPGDSHHINKTADILALPITAPWGSTTQAVDLALQLKPKVIIPIHDWLWKDGIRIAMYERLTELFKKHNIDFRGVETGETIEY